MSAFFWYASFPNSRIKPRPSTSQAQTYQVAINNYPPLAALTKIVDPDANRTYVIVKNLDAVTSLWYVYAAESLVNPSAVATFGVPTQLIYHSPSNQLYQKQDDGITTNWTAVQIEDVGESIQPLQSASLESPETYWAAADSAAPPAVQVIVGVDKGSG